ncbi:unnamed protein product [Acanthoscelides obtectus]|uniref:Uncharacterized protein n=1 Tax=Acanthoscelides obtectus TaxID=200917 RepID=A0A9P0PFU3_ACAOB|nr:unnamed protein product [Acanthoscelides obtectus]CAK1651136.1 hypothetical protein AOBTE_LOCUS17084 [Acanthoscelides obtectus]
MALNKGKRARGSNFTKEEELLLVRSVCISWGNYTSEKLKTPMSKRLRQTNSTSKNLFYEKKIMFAEEEIERSRLEQEDILIKRKRDAEKHEWEGELHRKKLELLEIEIKQRMLNN